MPVIEAMIYGKPIVSSSNSSLGELVNETRAYVISDPTSEVEIASAIRSYYNDSQNKPEDVILKIREAKKFAIDFTWDKSAHKLVHLLRSLNTNK